MTIEAALEAHQTGKAKKNGLIQGDKGSAEDKDVQPPHRQAGAYYKRVTNLKDGQFRVTMEHPSASNPKPMTIEITQLGARLLTVSATIGAAAIISTPARAG